MMAGIRTAHFAAVFVCLLCSSVCAEIVPGFDLSFATEHATHVLLVDRAGTVVEVWRGADVEAGERLPFAVGGDPIDVVNPFPNEPRNPDVAAVSGGRRALFVRRTQNGRGWEPVCFATKELRLATAWIEKGQCFAIYQIRNPGPGAHMHPLYIDEQRLKALVLEAGAEVAANRTAPTARDPSELVGEWRIFLPAGFEYAMTLSQDHESRFRLEPSDVNFAGLYERHDNQLVSFRSGESSGRYVWQIRSQYLLTLIEQPSGIGSSYLGAVLFRRQPMVED
jgi:hypothetical protein